MKLGPKRSPKVIFEEKPTQEGVPCKVGGAKQQEQTVPRETYPGKPIEIQHKHPVPLTQEDIGTPCRMTRPCHFPALLLFC